MSNTACAVTCAGRGFSVSGTQSGSEYNAPKARVFANDTLDACFCGNTLPYTLLEESYCTSACVGAAGEPCGSANTLSVYNATILAATVPKANTTSMSTTGVSSTSTGTASGTGIVASATSLVSSLLSGILSGTSSATSIRANATATTSNTTAPSTGSTTASATASAPSSSQTWVSRGCIADGSARALNQTSLATYDMTIPKCGALALAGGFRWFGLENAYQCFVSNTLAYNTSSTACTQACGGDAKTICGGPWCISLYEVVLASSLPAPTTSISTTASATSQASSAAPSSSSAPTSLSSTSAPRSGSGSATCAAVTVTQIITVTASSPSGTSTSRIARRRHAAASHHVGLDHFVPLRR
jgi:hypothetical protein